MKPRMSKFQIWMLRKIVFHCCLQGSAYARLPLFFLIVIDEVRRYYREDNDPTTREYIIENLEKGFATYDELRDLRIRKAQGEKAVKALEKLLQD